MWWKTLSVALIIYAITAGMLVPLKPGITYVSPGVVKSGQDITLRVFGYNSFYTKARADEIRIWLQFDESNAVLGQKTAILNDTTVEASFQMPSGMPEKGTFAMLNVIVDHPVDGVSLLPSAVEFRLDTTATSKAGWQDNPIEQLHIVKDLSYPYRNVIYESIRNTYYHVPMWFALMFMFLGSVIYSIRYLKSQHLDDDKKAVAFTEAGLLFGLLGLVTGMLWAHYAWGAAWSNDIKQLMTAVALLVYLAYFILRSSFDEPEKGARLSAVYNIFAFASLVPLLYIVPRMFASLHPGAEGSPAFGSQDLDNTMRMVFYPSIIGFSLLGLWLAQLRYRYAKIQDVLYDID
ncbi:MAG: cytochrome c biogenesis protein [Saprospiraceae bacterium]